jgi:hypothetical protein
MMPCRQLVSTALRLCAVAVLCADGIAMRGRAQAPVTTIQPSAGFAVDRTIAPKTADRYELSLAEGQFVDLVVAFTNDADALRVTLSDPAGTALVYFDRVRTSSGAQRLSYVADRSGIYGLAIAAAVEATDIIAYRLNLSELRDATDADRGRGQALSEFLSATALAEMGRYRIVHFATHALLNSRHPELSGIILSLVDRDAQPIDGFLRLHDVYNLPLNADLVVLSACRTALGKDISGEGLVGLTRGFMYAGAPAVVASLWDVRDRSTSELMTRFYRAMLRDGLAPAAALRAAQASMWRSPRWSAPAHWAGFILQGDWQHRD